MSVPGKLTAMENWGLSMYNRQVFVVDVNLLRFAHINREALLLDEVNCDIEER